MSTPANPTCRSAGRSERLCHLTNGRGGPAASWVVTTFDGGGRPLSRAFGNKQMTREKDLIRLLLLHLEGAEDVSSDLSRYSDDQVRYHRAILQDAGLITTEMYYDIGVSPAALIRTRLTWQGHDFLDSVRDSRIWSAVKQRIAGLASWTLPILADIAKDEIRKRVGL